MPVIVQKFGGSSLADAEAIERCASRAIGARDTGRSVVVVVSAMGRATDELLGLAGVLSDRPSPRELDALLATGEQASAAIMAIALEARGATAVSRSARDLGITTDGAHGEARVRSIDVGRLRADLDAGRIVVVPGFQGVGPDGALTTFGRGGTDITAVAIATALDGAEAPGEPHAACEIITDVDGVHSADPRIVPEARRIDHIGFDVMSELAAAGAGVVHPRAVAVAARRGVPITVRDSRGGSGTRIAAPDSAGAALDRPSVVGCALTIGLARLTIGGRGMTATSCADILEHLARRRIPLEGVVQSAAAAGTRLDLLVRDADLAAALHIMETSAGAGLESRRRRDLARVTAVGPGVGGDAGIGATLLAALGRHGIDVVGCAASTLAFAVLVPRADGERALRTVHEALGLGDIPALVPAHRVDL